MIARLWAFLSRLCLLAGCGGFAGGLAAVAARFPIPALVIAGVIAVRSQGRRRVSTSYGSATIATDADCENHGLYGGSGLILGRSLPESPPRRAALAALLAPGVNSETACRMFLAAFLGKAWLQGRMLRLGRFCHLASFSPSGGGKGVSVIIPNLLSYRYSCVVTDPKGENAKITGRFRQRKFGHTVIYLNPFGLHGLGSASLNPLDSIDDKADDFLDQCRELADMLVIRSGKEEPHWPESSVIVLTAMIAFVCGFEKDRGKRNLQTVRMLISSKASYTQAVEVMQQVKSCQGVIRRLGGQLTFFEGKELGSVLTTTLRHTQFLDSPAVARNTASSSFDPMVLRKKKATVYLILPADKLSSLSRLQRMWIATIMRVVTAGTPSEKNPVLWLLDEMAHIGNIEAVTDAVTLKRGMGMRLWFFFQSREQLKICFGDKAGTVLDNIGTQQYFGINSYDTSEELSKRIGDATIAINTGSTSISDSMTSGGGANGNQGSRSNSRTTNSSEIARRLLKPEEILTLPRDVALVFTENLPVIPARLLRYYDAPEFRWGGTGGKPGLGLAGGVMAASVLAASLAFAGAAFSLAGPPPAPPATPLEEPVFDQVPAFGTFEGPPARRRR